jgi:hypothetical protein
MSRLLSSDLELMVKSGFIYVPLVFDPDIAREIRTQSDSEGLPNKPVPATSNTVAEVEGRHFIKSVTIQSVLSNYERIDKGYHEQLKKGYPWESQNLPRLDAISPNGKLHTIVFKILPYFVRKGMGLERKRLDEDGVLELIGGKLDIPRNFIEQADKHLDPGALLRRLNDLDRLEGTVEPLQDGPITGEDLRRWLHNALEVQAVHRERARIEQELRERERVGRSKRSHIATLLYLAERGSFELDGFGFSRISASGDYLIYKHTGEYILEDYYARRYLFPDCRVAVSTSRAFRPFVIELYKHPFLFGHAPKQEICMGGEYDWPDEFTAEHTVRLLEDGINALLYGYDPRRRNGYHSLDPTVYYVKTIEFNDYRV